MAKEKCHSAVWHLARLARIERATLRLGGDRPIVRNTCGKTLRSAYLSGFWGFPLCPFGLKSTLKSMFDYKKCSQNVVKKSAVQSLNFMRGFNFWRLFLFIFLVHLLLLSSWSIRVLNFGYIRCNNYKCIVLKETF